MDDHFSDGGSGNLCNCFSLQIRSEAIVALLRERENESSTAISDFVAIPHVIIGGEKQFHLALVRSVEGIRFSEGQQAVHAVFILVGSKDMRNLHLRALAAIAQVVQQPSFAKRWMKGKNHQ